MPSLEQELVQFADVLGGASNAALLPHFQQRAPNGRLQFNKDVLGVMSE